MNLGTILNQVRVMRKLHNIDQASKEQIYKEEINNYWYPASLQKYVMNI